MTVTTKLFTFFRGRLVGHDQFGNRYYTEKRTSRSAPAKRWVMYKGYPDPSKVPAEWHGWLHYTLDLPPSERATRHYGWEKPHLPNLTGTIGAYLPPGHLQKGGNRAESTADYEPWRP